MNNTFGLGRDIADILQSLNKKQPEPPKQTMVLDSVVFDATDARSAFAIAEQKLNAAAAVQEFAETNREDLDEDETLCDRFFALLACNCDTDDDGELSREEEEYVYQAYNMAAAYLIQCGVSPEDVEAFINDDDEVAAANIQELLRSVLPDGAESSLEDIDNFAFGDNDGSTDSVFDSASNGGKQAVMDAVYKKTRVVRNGRKVVIRKRVSGHIRLTSAQKVAIRKMHRKSHSGRANMKRLKSMRKREKLGMNK